MNDPRKQIEVDVRAYVAKEGNLNEEDRIRALMAVVDKHFTFASLSHVVNSGDIFLVSSMAKQKYVEQTVPMFVSKQQIPYDDLRTVAVMEAFLGYLNNKYLLIRSVSINYTRDKV